MVCLVAEVLNGALRSGAVRIKLAQDIYSQPDIYYGEIELGDDPRPPTEPSPVQYQVAFEAPYLDLAANQGADDLRALPSDAGYLVAAAVDPGRMRDFTLSVALAGGQFTAVADGEFCATCVVRDPVPAAQQTGIHFVQPDRLGMAQPGDWGIWDGEIIRLDAVDIDAGTMSLGRGCADTIPKDHAAGSRIFIYRRLAAADPTQRIAGETIDAKILVNSYSQRLDPGLASTMQVEFASRAARPYPPGDIRINGVSIHSVGDGTPSPAAPGSGSGPSSPPAQTTAGGVASRETGPHGGYPDTMPFQVPEPTAFETDVIVGGDFSAAASIDDWRDGSGNPLDSRWSIVDGRLCYHGIGRAAAYYWPARRTLAQQLLPHYSFSVTAQVECEPGAVASIGVGLGASTNTGLTMAASYDQDAYGERAMSVPAAYGVAAAVSHAYADRRQQYGVSGSGQIVHTIATPAVLAEVDGTQPARVYFDDVQMQVYENAPAVTAVGLANLDFASGLSGWVQFPPASPISPSPVVTAGECRFTPVSEFGTHKYLINTDSITDLDTVGKWLRIAAKVWCDDPTVVAGVTRAGVGLQIAVNSGGEWSYVGWTNPVERGDWTQRVRWLRQQFTAPGTTFHLALLFRAWPGYSVAVKEISASVTDSSVT